MEARRSGRVSRILSSAVKRRGDHLSGPTVARRLEHPTRSFGTASPCPHGHRATGVIPRGGPPLAAYLGLLAVGFTLPRPSPAARCALTAPFHPYQEEASERQGPRVVTIPPQSSNGAIISPALPPAVCFLWHFPSAHAGLALPTTVPCPVRTFLTSVRRTRDHLRPLRRIRLYTRHGTRGHSTFSDPSARAHSGPWPGPPLRACRVEEKVECPLFPKRDRSLALALRR
jgi:hypothetical protein